MASLPVSLAGYEILSLIGSGTYGKVYKAVAKNWDQTLVLKQVPLTGLSSSEQQETINESHLMNQLADHENLVKHYVSFIENDILNIVMEFCAGGDLAKRIKHAKEDHATFNEETVWSVLIQVCSALKHLHNHRVLHRDVKPENIFLDEEDRVKVGDLGLGRLLSSQSHLAHSTVGTPLYFSPELCEEALYDERSDVWALGCLVYQMATLRPPFVASNQIALAKKIVNEPPEPLPKSCSVDLHFLIHKMLEKDPQKRPDTSQILSYGPVRIRMIQAQLKRRENELQHDHKQRENYLIRELKRLREEHQRRVGEYNALYAQHEMLKEAHDELKRECDEQKRASEAQAERARELEGQLAAQLEKQQELDRHINDVEAENDNYRSRLDSYVVSREDIKREIESVTSAETKHQDLSDDVESATIGDFMADHTHPAHPRTLAKTPSRGTPARRSTTTASKTKSHSHQRTKPHQQTRGKGTVVTCARSAATHVTKTPSRITSNRRSKAATSATVHRNTVTSRYTSSRSSQTKKRDVQSLNHRRTSARTSSGTNHNNQSPTMKPRQLNLGPIDMPATSQNSSSTTDNQPPPTTRNDAGRKENYPNSGNAPVDEQRVHLWDKKGSRTASTTPQPVAKSRIAPMASDAHQLNKKGSKRQSQSPKRGQDAGNSSSTFRSPASSLGPAVRVPVAPDRECENVAVVFSEL